MRKLKLEELGRLSVDAYKESNKLPIILVADNIRSGLNVGSFFRSADAFGIEKIVLCGLSPKPPHREINKSAIGATASVSWEYEEDIINAVKQLKESGYQIIGIEQTTDSQTLSSYKTDGMPMALIMGNEVEGLTEGILDLLDTVLEIPQFGTKHSLNVAVCAGICLYELSCQFRENSR